MGVSHSANHEGGFRPSKSFPYSIYEYAPRTRLDLLRSSIQNRVIQKQANDKQRHDAHAAERTFRAGDTVRAMNFQGKPKWIATVVENQLGPLTFIVRLKDGRMWKRHQDHLRERRPNENDEFRPNKW